MQFARPQKGYFNELEAAQALNLSPDQFRALVRRHILRSDDEAVNLPMTSFQPSDLLLLRLLLTQEPKLRAVAG